MDEKMKKEAEDKAKKDTAEKPAPETKDSKEMPAKKDGDSKPAPQKEEEAEEDEADASHPDEAKDVELIKKMLKQYLGDEDAESDEAIKAAKEAYEAHKEMGKESEEALKHAGEAMKLAKHMAGKKKKSEAEESEESEEAEETEESEKCECEAEESEEAEESVKESNIELKGEVAKLKEELRKYKIAEYLDKKLSESKLPVRVTEQFREAVGSPKNEAEIDRSLNAFLKGLKASERKSDGLDHFVMVEKNTIITEDREAMTNFADCR